MNQNIQQNGGQPPLRRSNENQSKVCRDYVWGKCYKYSLCKFSHECSVEDMKTILQFCHDYQNPTGCTRANCTYLHTTSEEEDLFLKTGQMPRVLAERHSAIHAAASMYTENSKEFIRKHVPAYVPHTAHSLAPPPPPPPPPTTEVPTRQYILPMTQLAPPPPPPPPPPESMSSAYPGAPPPRPPPVFAPALQPPPLTIDTSKPPPPLPSFIKSPNGVKRTTATETEGDMNLFSAGPSKARKVDAVASVSRCAICTQWEARTSILEEDIVKLAAEEKSKTLIMKKYRKELEVLTNFLKSYNTLNLSPLEPELEDETPNPFGSIITADALINSLKGQTQPTQASAEDEEEIKRFLDSYQKSGFSVPPPKGVVEDRSTEPVAPVPFVTVTSLAQPPPVALSQVPSMAHPSAAAPPPIQPGWPAAATPQYNYMATNTSYPAYTNVWGEGTSQNMASYSDPAALAAAPSTSTGSASSSQNVGYHYNKQYW
ncbi:YLP motif-containing protein 1-like [Achroia grisella]|uniref:YLP motif-containing protein 1-like n=1 Tax=Achroia grisella TaxID=688607 RepID=UPI0027D2A0B0|nr:YLP motif-containing protein 1-like [Achroia grisella]